jgi:hypothetical protein
MKLCDLVIAVLLAIIVVLAVIYQFGDHADLARKNCVKTTANDEQLAVCIRNIR